MRAADRRRVADELVSYLTARAEVEGVAMTLDSYWFNQVLKTGIRIWFGIEVNSRGIVADLQQPWPGFLDAWRRQQHAV